MRGIKIAVAQIQPRKSAEALKAVTHAVFEARRLGAEIVCLPEAWNVVNPYSQFLETVNAYDDTAEALCRLAEENGMWILGGGLYKRDEKDDYVITCPVIDDRGNVAGEQLKVHLFKNERNTFKRGEEFNIYQVGNVKFGVLICHDIVYPEAARELTLKGAELIFNPSRIVSIGVKAWHIYARARSLENRIPLAAANVVLGGRYGGGSVILGLVRRGRGVVYPVTLAKAGEREEIIAASIDVDEYVEARLERLSNRYPKAYPSLTKTLKENSISDKWSAEETG